MGEKMKLNRKGFMLAEVVVSASVVAVVLVTMYIGINRMTAAYDKRNRYYDLDAQQVAMEVNDILVRNPAYLNDETDGILNRNKSDWLFNLCDSLSDDYDTFPVDLMSNFGYKNVNIYFSLYSKDKLNELKTINNVTETLKQYIDYISDKTNFDENYSYFIMVELKKDDDYYYYTLKVK